MNALPGGIREAWEAQRRKSPRILWVTGAYFPDIGGAEWSAFANVSILKRHYGQMVLASTEQGPRVVDGVPVLETGSRYRAAMEHAIDRFAPDYVATQGLLANTALNVALERGIPAVYFLRAHTGIDFSGMASNPLLRVVSNSEWMGDHFHGKWGIKTIVLDPVVLPWLVKASAGDHGYVTHVGDAKVKGGARVLEIAKRLPEVDFLVTKSWPALREGDRWNAARIDQLRQEDGSTTDFEAAIADLGHAGNIKLIWPLLSPRDLYAQTQILLVASKWREPYGRVVVEGLLNGLPVVVGPEVHNAAWEHLVYQVKDGDDIREWARVIGEIRRNGMDAERAGGIAEFQKSFGNSDQLETLRTMIFHA